jgi:hypothetical protein
LSGPAPVGFSILPPGPIGARGVRAIVRQTPDTINTGPGARRPGWADGFAAMTAHDVKQPIVFPRRDCARVVN